MRVSLFKFDEIKQVVGEEYAPDWCRIHTKVFYKNNKPYGLVGTRGCPKEGRVLIASTTKDPEDPFTTNMYKYMLNINKRFPVTLITDMPEYQEKVRQGLAHQGFTFYYEDDIMYSKRGVHNGETSS